MSGLGSDSLFLAALVAVLGKPACEAIVIRIATDA